MKTFGIIFFLLFAFILLEYVFFYTALNSSLMLPPFEQELVMIFTLSSDDCVKAFKTGKVINRLEYNAKNNVAVCRIVFKSSLEYF